VAASLAGSPAQSVWFRRVFTTCGVCDSDVRTGQPVALQRFGSAVQEVFVMPVLPGGRYPDLIDDDANLPKNSFVPPDEAPRDVPGSPSAGGWATSYLFPPKLGRSSRPVRFAGREPTAALRASVRRHRSHLVRSIRRALTWQFMDLPTAPWRWGRRKGVPRFATP
jgi:hypothetical protein